MYVPPQSDVDPIHTKILGFVGSIKPNIDEFDNLGNM